MKKNTVDISDLLNWLTTKNAITAISIERQFNVGHIISKEVTEVLILMGFLKRGTFFFPVNHHLVMAKIESRTVEGSELNQSTEGGVYA